MGAKISSTPITPAIVAGGGSEAMATECGEECEKSEEREARCESRRHV